MTTPIKITDLAAMKGQEMPSSSWLEVTQERVNRFADATDDHQFIHVDEERAADTPFGGTIAHGYLTLSMLSYLLTENAIPVQDQVMAINYGSDKVRYLAPVLVGSRIRARQVLLDCTEKQPGRWLSKTAVTVEIENQEKPAMIAEILSMRIIKN